MPEMLKVPVGPAVLPGLLLVTIKTVWDPAIGVSSAFTLLRRVFTLSTMLPAGAGPIVFATKVAAAPPPGNPSFVRTTESAVIVIADGVVAAVPPKIRELIVVSLRRMLVAAVPGPP